jgi:DNA invertase Pin-like site-specific DNA recombinase
MHKVITYTRVSTKDQGKSGLGLDAQNRDIRLYLERYQEQPFEVIGEFRDVMSGADKSDSNDLDVILSKRPGLREAMALASDTGATLLVSKLDRLSREVFVIAGLMRRKDITFKVASMPHAGNFELHIYAALAQQEREFISERTKAALAEAKARNTKLGGSRPETLKRNAESKAEAQERAQGLADIILPLRADGATLRDIAAHLTETGVKTERGGDWTPTQVSRILKRLGVTS